MKKLSKPTDTAKDVFNTCISRVRDADLKSRFERCENEIVLASNDFEQKVSLAQLHKIKSSDNVGNIVTAEEMKKVYTDRMVNKTSSGREYYDKLMAIPKHGRCPLCGQRVVSTLDHHLPKAHFPALAVAPLNLIASCKDCNTTKTDSIPKSSNEETIHPYFDNVDEYAWLCANVIEEKPTAIVFSVLLPDVWKGSTLGSRIKYHFKVFKLAELYASHAAEELQNIQYILNQLYELGGVDAVKSFLSESAKSRSEINKNSWQAAFYNGLANNDWFCNESWK